MSIAERLQKPSPSYSFEFFPPKTEAGLHNLLDTLRDLRDLEPSFVSMTYGAGGSTQRSTTELTARIKHEIGIEAMAHLTCVGNSQAELASTLDALAAAGIDNVLALRGDRPSPVPSASEPVLAAAAEARDELSYASQLVRFMRSDRKRWPFCIGGACYPEGHIECPKREDDLRHLAEKVEAGTEFLITQLFFDNAFYFDFVQRAQAMGGTCTGEHGIGLGKREKLVAEFGDPAVELMRRLKDAWDPHGILNPGKIFLSPAP